MYTTAHEISLDGESLREVDERIIVQGFSTDGAKISQATATAFGRPGQRVTNEHRDYIDVTVTFGIRIKKNDMNARSEVLEAVNTWASAARDGAWLTSEQKEERKIWVRLQQPATEGDLWQWTNSFNIVFRAYGIPYWQDENPIRVSKTAVSSWSQNISVSGNEKTVVDFKYTNTTASSCTTITIKAGDSEMKFTGLAIAQNEVFEIGHDENGRLHIRIRSTAGVYRSAMAARNSDSSYQSADDLWVNPGIANVNITAQRAGTMEISTVGRWM